MSIKQNVKEWFEDKVLKVLERHNFVNESTLLREIQDAKDDVWSDTISRDDLDNLIYEVEENERNIEDHENRIDTIEIALTEVKKMLEKHDKIVSRMRITSGSLQMFDNVEVVKENIDEK